MVGADDDESGIRPLTRVARALGVPVETFFESVARDPAGPSEAEEAEEAELLGLFRELRDPQQRARCLALIRGMANLSRDDGAR